MKILNQPPVPPPYRFLCWRCKAEIEAEENEGKKFTSPKNEDCITFECPLCKADNVKVRHSYMRSL